jgi:hypothetical protein
MAPGETTTLNTTIRDEFSNSIATFSTGIVANNNGAASATVTAPSSSLGYYQIEADLADGHAQIAMLGTRPTGIATYAVISDPSTRKDYGDAGSRFGLQGGYSVAQGSVIPYLGVRYVIGPGGGWAALEPNSSGQFATDRAAANAMGQQYPALDPVTSGLVYNGIPWNTYDLFFISIATIPSWAGPISGTSGNTTNFGALNTAGQSGITAFATAYGNEVATDFKNQTNHYYQVTWEPEKPGNYSGSAAQLVQYFSLTYAALHAQAGPTLFPVDSETSYGQQIQALWAAGLGSYLDAESMHPYASSATAAPETTNFISDLTTQISLATAAVGHSIPFIGTEHGYSSGSITTLQQAEWDIRQAIIVLGLGFKFDFGFYIADFWTVSPVETENLYGFYYNLNPHVSFGTNKIGPKIAVPAFSAMTLFLDGTTSNGTISGTTGSQLGYKFTNGAVKTVAVWDYLTTSNISIPASGAVQQCTWMGNCTPATISGGNISLSLGPTPIYLIGPGL